MTTDALIIGGGHNGLVCGAYLAKAGLNVKVLERRSVIGGAVVTEEFHPEFRSSTFSYLMSLLHPRVIHDLELRKHGLEVLPCSDMFSPLDDGDYIVFSDDVAKTQKQFARFNKADAERYVEFDRYINEAATIIRALLFETPPDPSKRDWKTYKQLLGLAWKHRKIGGKMYRVIDLLTMSADGFLKRWFEDSRIRAVLAYYGSIGTFTGPKSPGSAYVIMHHIMGEHEGAGGWGFIKGGMGAITEAIASYGRTLGLEIVTDAPIETVKISEGRATGVVTEDGREYDARVVISNASVKALFLSMVAEEHLPTDFLFDVRNYRTFSTAFKINVAAERPPRYASLQRALKNGALGDWSYPTYCHIAPDIDYLERAYDDAKYGWYSASPFMTQVAPSIVDDSLAPAGKHTINLFGGHAPYELKGGDWAQEKDKFRDVVLKTIDRFAPGFSDDVIATQVLLPQDIERIVNLPQGHIFQGELSPDQLFLKRPVPHYADYRTPIQSLYQCGSSTHPGGGVSGIPGHNAAREVLKDLRR